MLYADQIRARPTPKMGDALTNRIMNFLDFGDANCLSQKGHLKSGIREKLRSSNWKAVNFINVKSTYLYRS